LFFQVRPSTSQDDLATPDDVLPDKPMDKLDQANQAGTKFMPSTSTPNGNVQQPIIDRGVSHGVVTRSAARYLSICLYLFQFVPFFSYLIFQI
jgi:hypothetical protein